MCRLFGMIGGAERVDAKFWLLDAPDSMLLQSRKQPDGAGLGWYDEHKRPQRENDTLAAHADIDFVRQARLICSTSSIAHLRFASTGAVSSENTHPFEQNGLLFAHNGEVGEIDRIKQRLSPEFQALVQGQTDSECIFALITQEIAQHDGDVSAAITAAATWVAQHLPVFALNMVLIGPHDLWALRYPARHELHVLDRQAGGTHGDREFVGVGSEGRMRVESPTLAAHRSVVVASEQLDSHPGWSALDPGELLHVGRDLVIRRTLALPAPPARPLGLDDLDERAAASQH